MEHSPLAKGDCVVLSLRWGETAEAISKCIENKEIATLPSVARNDNQGVAAQSQGEEWEKKESWHP